MHAIHLEYHVALAKAVHSMLFLPTLGCWRYVSYLLVYVVEKTHGRAAPRVGGFGNSIFGYEPRVGLTL